MFSMAPQGMISVGASGFTVTVRILQANIVIVVTFIFFPSKRKMKQGSIVNEQSSHSTKPTEAETNHSQLNNSNVTKLTMP